jgi:hypothetical protein
MLLFLLLLMKMVLTKDENLLKKVKLNAMIGGSVIRNCKVNITNKNARREK